MDPRRAQLYMQLEKMGKDIHAKGGTKENRKSEAGGGDAQRGWRKKEMSGKGWPTPQQNPAHPSSGSRDPAGCVCSGQ